MKKEFQDEFWSLLTDALADANKNLQQKGPIVFNGQRPNEANYGISPQNPLCSTSLGGTEAYLQRLRTLDGRKFTWNRAGDERADCNGAKDIGMDKYQLYLDGHPYKILYFVPYVGESTDAPHGMKLISDNATEDVMPSAQQDTLSQEVFEPATSVAKQPIKVKVRAKSVPKGTGSVEPPIQSEDSQSTKQEEHTELQNDDPIVESIETPKVEPTSSEMDQFVAGISLPNSEEENDTPRPSADENTRTKPSRKKWKPLLFSAIGVVLAAVVALLIIHFLPEKVNQQDINTIYGCPELYDVEFGTDIDTVDSLIKIEHDTIMPHPLGDDEPTITLKVDAEFEIYDLPVQNFICSFDDDKLEMVLVFFEKENVTYEQIIKLYTKIYGQETISDTSKTVWSGTKTIITIFNDSEDDVYVVRYAETPNLRFTMLSFDGAEIDPCGFLSDNYIFDKTASHYTIGLQKDKDYSMQHLSAAGFASFSKYTLYPTFEYMGIESGYTAIEFDVDDSEKTIGVVSYLFYLNQQNALDRIDYIKDALDQTYGQFNSCTYTSTNYSDMGIVNLTFDEAKSKISAGTQGIYNIQWKIDGYNITLGLTIQTDSSYYDGSVAFSIPDPHEHEYTLKSETAATCEKDGKKEYVCDCGDSYSETVKATGHSYSSATCTKPATCASCGATTGSKGDHTYTPKVTSATCAAQGYTTYTCSCGNSYVSDYTPASKHNYQNYKCTICGMVDKANAVKYLEHWVKTNGKYDSETPYYYYLDMYQDEGLCYSISFSISGNTIFIDRANDLEGTLGYTIIVLSDYSYRTEFGDLSIKGTISANSFTKNSSISYTAYACPDSALPTMKELAKASIVDTLDWLAWFLEANNIGITLGDLGFKSY